MRVTLQTGGAMISVKEDTVLIIEENVNDYICAETCNAVVCDEWIKEEDDGKSGR